MPSFILRNLDPEFWRKVQAKADAEGVKIYDLIVRLLTQWLAAALLVGLVSGCAYRLPAEPTTTTAIADTVPFTLSLGAVSGMGVEAGTATITAKVQNVSGAPLAGVTVTFSTDAGELSATAVVTGANGVATTTIAMAGSAGVTATAGTLTTHTLVASQPITAMPTPLPVPPSNPTPPGPGALSVSLTTGGDVTIGAQTIFTASTQNGPALAFLWTFGDGSGVSGTSGSTVHAYGATGSYVAGVTVTDALGRRASASTTATVNAAPVPPPPAPLTLSAALGCTAAAHTICNVSATYGGAALPASSMTETRWDWGDGTALEPRFPPNAPTGQHNYLQAGTYTVMVTVFATTMTDGVKTATTSKAVVIP